MTRRTGGAVRDRRILERRSVPRLADRALSADVATNAVTAANVVSVPKVVPKIALDDADLVALITGSDKIQPVAMGNVRAFLESVYELTPKT